MCYRVRLCDLIYANSKCDLTLYGQQQIVAISIIGTQVERGGVRGQAGQEL